MVAHESFISCFLYLFLVIKILGNPSNKTKQTCNNKEPNYPLRPIMSS